MPVSILGVEPDYFESFSNNRFERSNGGKSVELLVPAVGSLGAGNTFEEGIHVHPGAVEAETVWRDHGAPYVVHGRLDIGTKFERSGGPRDINTNGRCAKYLGANPPNRSPRPSPASSDTPEPAPTWGRAGLEQDGGGGAGTGSTSRDLEQRRAPQRSGLRP